MASTQIYNRHQSTQAIDRRGFWGTIKLGAIIALIIILFALCEGI